MTSRERVIKALTFDSPDRAPRQLWVLLGVGMFRADEVARVRAKFPDDIVVPPLCYGRSKRARGGPGEIGEYIDEWGGMWRASEAGVVGEVRRPVLGDWSAFNDYQPPWEQLEGADLSQVNSMCAGDTFVLANTITAPFERMQFLRGTENLLMDLAYGEPDVCRLRDMVHDFMVADIQMWAKTNVDGIRINDDWGTQISLLISPEKWREVFKPLYKDYCDIIHAAGKFMFFHSDGFIEPIFPDLIEVGMDAINSQLFCMDIEKLARLYKGKVTFWGEIDRQTTLPFGTPADVRAAVRRVRAALDDGTGGLIAQCQWGTGNRVENVEAVFEEWGR